MADFPFRQDEHYTLDPGTGCWNWTGPCERHGYAIRGGRKAARLAWEAQHGPIPEGLLLRHLCHNRRCIRPAHLAPGTHTDNGRDMRLAGRGSKRTALLAQDDVRAIVRRCEREGEAVAGVAAALGVRPEVLRKALQGQSYRAELAAARQALGLVPPVPPARRLGGPAAALPLYGEILTWRRERLGLTQHALAAALGCGASFVSMIEGGGRPPRDHAPLAAALLALPATVLAERVLAARLPEEAPLYERLFGAAGWLRPELEQEAAVLLRMMGQDVAGT
jgi:transcriptional regulator with XRE-family HTH domain